MTTRKPVRRCMLLLIGVAVAAAAAAAQAADLGPAPRVAGHAGVFAPASVPSLDGSPVEYLILTRSDLGPEFQRLADWKTAKGVPAVVRTLDDVLAQATPGSDLPETIRNYLRAAYDNWGVRFVLLGGDTDIIPPRYASIVYKQIFRDPPTDLYYACLDGTWNQDGDGDFGEAFVNLGNVGDDADLVAEVFLGRAPVTSVAEARVFVDKTLAVEVPEHTDFQSRLLLLAEVLDQGGYDPIKPPNNDGALIADIVATLAPPNVSVTRLYEAAPLWPGSIPLTRAATMSQVSAGYGAIVHVGHGYRYTLSCGDGSLNVGDAASFANGTRLGLFYMLNCTAAAFDFESFAESMLLNPNGGAAAVIGTSREAFPVTSVSYQTAFFRRIYELGERRIGVALAESRHEFVDDAALVTADRWTQLVYTLLGDPELGVWTRARTDLAVLGMPAAIALGKQALALQVRNAGGALPGARIAALKDGDEYRVTWTDASGHASFELEPKTAGSVTFTITAPDHVPLQLQRNVQPGTVALALLEPGLVDDGGDSGSGNSDGRLDAAETARLWLPLRNSGSGSATSISAVLASVDPDLEVLQGSSSYPDLGPGADASANVPFIVRVAAGAADSRVAAATLTLSHVGGSETRRVSLQLHAPHLRIVSLSIDDTRAGNGNGVQDAGEEIDLFYELENVGSGTSTGVALHLADATGGLQILQGTSAVPDLFPGARGANLVGLAVREPDVSVSRGVRLALRAQQSSANHDRRLELRLPQAPAGLGFAALDDPDDVHLDWLPNTEPDLLGYVVYRGPDADGPFARVNTEPTQHAYYRDQDLQPSTRYFYCVAALDSAGVEGAPGSVKSVSTNPPQLDGWPLATARFSSSSPAVADADGNGSVDVLAVAENLYAWDAAGVELRDADNDARTWGVYFGSSEVYSSIAAADLDAVPGQEIVAVSWDANQRLVVAVGRNGQMLPGWPRHMLPGDANTAGSAVPPVVASLNPGAPPVVLVASRDGRLYAWNADGKELADGDANPATDGVLLDTGNAYLRCAPVVADLDPGRPGLEVAIGSANLDALAHEKLHVIDAAGQALPGWPRTGNAAGQPFGSVFTTGISAGDLDRDGRMELVFVDANSRLHAMHLDGTELPGYPIGNIKSAGTTVAPSPALGDLAGDADLEVVVASIDGNVSAFTASGVPIMATIVTGARSESSPLLGDVDGDGEIEILFGNEEGVLAAWNLDGTPVDGFPISSRAEVRATPTLADVGGDGQADLVVQSWDGRVNVFGLGVPWIEARFPWPTHRGNNWRTGEFGFDVPTPVVVSDLRAAWAGGSGVHIAWRGASDAGDVAWRVYRQGPFADNPLESDDVPAYTSTLLVELRGQGELEASDADVELDRWYVYTVTFQEDRQGGHGDEVVGGRVAIQTRPAPGALRLLPNVPNPFNPRTRLHFEVPSGRGVPVVSLTLHDASGRRVRTLLARHLPPGTHSVQWDGLDDRGDPVGSGVYVARLEAAGVVTSRKLMLLR